ncbi:MAG: STAS domain-containing protein [Myxococcaceae bacterium]
MDLETGRDEQRETVTLKVEGTFDREAATQLRTRLEALGQANVIIDFSRVRTFRDVAIGVLAGGLQVPSLRLRGLDTHQERVFRYLGIGALPPPRGTVELDA